MNIGIVNMDAVLKKNIFFPLPGEDPALCVYLSPHALCRVIGVIQMPFFMSSFSNLLPVIPAHGTRRLTGDSRLMTTTPNCCCRPWISYHPTLPSAE